MVCDRRELKAVDYPELFDVLGYVYGRNGSDTFKIPDYGGYFLRGAPVSDAKVKNDPEAECREFKKDGASKEAGSIQTDAIQNTHINLEQW